jgi:hypothetical protein
VTEGLTVATKRASSKSAKGGTAALNEASDALMRFLQTEGVTRALEQAARDPKVRQAASKNPTAWLHANKLEAPSGSTVVVSEDVSPTNPSHAAICLTIYVGDNSRWYCGRHCVRISSN